MKVILINDVKNVGKKDQVVDVAEGYAINFLVKRGLAVLPNKANLNDLNRQKEEEAKKDLASREKANELKERLKSIKLIFVEKAGIEDRLQGAITGKIIEEKLAKEYNVSVDKKNFKNFMPIKALGKVEVEVILYKEIVGVIKIEVVGKE